MKKFIILGLVVLFVLLSAQGLYKVKKPARFDKWIKIGGDFIPIWDGRSNLGHSSYWFDSSFVEHGWFNYIQIDSGGYLGLDSLSVDGDIHVTDTSFLGGAVVCSSTVKIEGITTFNDASVWMLGDTLFFTDGGADTSYIVQDGANLVFNTDNSYYFMGGALTFGYAIQCQNDIIGTADDKTIQWDGKWCNVDFDADDSLSGIIFGLTDTLKWDSIPETFTLTAGLIIDDGVNDTTKIDSTGIYTTGNLTVSGEIIGSSNTRGQATFTRNTEVDTIEISGVTTNSFVFITPKMTTPLTAQLTWTYLNTDSILVHIAPADTTGQAVIYCWFRIE